DWNESAPHGSGRKYKRTEVKNQFTVSAFKTEMKGIYSTCIGEDTLDEAPFAYRNIEDILKVVEQTVTVTDTLKSVYNYKAGDKK
ncbi:MAG: RtcB family protein, partial [Lachnospiraceae bacterium]|nr:RtcB family protein [Lachnospiraceae bacterium]